MKYAVYARKSSEGDEEQMLSIPSQLEEMDKLSKKIPNLPKELIVLEEAKSAKMPGKRAKFNELLELVKAREIDTILVWQPDRLSRNPMDAAQIIALIDEEKLARVITHSQTFVNTPMDKFMLGFFMIQAKFENDKKGEDVVRGLNRKASMGWYPTVAPPGYSNTPGEKKGFRIIKNDPDKFLLVKRCFQEILAGSQACDVWQKARNTWKLTGKHGGKLAASTFYNMLGNPLYYGEFEWPVGSGKWFPGLHEPMITKEEFDIIQRMLGKFGKPIKRSHQFNLTGLMRCEECKCSITASNKTKHYAGTHRTAQYTYYHCSKKHRDQHCKQKPITEAKLNEQIEEILLSIRPPEEFMIWAKKWLKTIHQDEYLTQETILSSQQEALRKTENRLNTLLDMRLDERIDENIYNTKKITLEEEKRELERKLANTNKGLSDNRQRIENVLDLAYAAQHKFQTGTREEKHKLLLDLSSNLTYYDKKIRIHLLDHYSALEKPQNWEEKYKKRLEPQKYTDTLIKYPDLVPANPIWLPR